MKKLSFAIISFILTLSVIPQLTEASEADSLDPTISSELTNKELTLTTKSGNLERFVETIGEHKVERTLSVEATAYTAHCEGCSGITKTGINLLQNPDKKVIAVDPEVIPLGTKVWVEGYGVAIAGDIGGAIEGNRIDVFIQSEDEAFRFGRRDDVEIKLLSDA
ncbi:hypothetical protein N781_04000 [Pontibacillus halophilus JSM 076056 = DSM 19796]|uniref:3D domain-containing protein n=1 Tax=Pontibacillus halophilus JSM 076056 = DSM 19796 TaxID=1385510 RepID=A0A0A5GKF8_9BACI|nr:hypothetical protein N781_04000 [Pontibacillus halophilus JSM 076056 = DSM 19796]